MPLPAPKNQEERLEYLKEQFQKRFLGIQPKPPQPNDSAAHQAQIEARKRQAEERAIERARSPYTPSQEALDQAAKAAKAAKAATQPKTKEGQSLARCLAYRDAAVQDPTVKKLLRHLDVQHGWDVTPEDFIQCISIPKPTVAGALIFEKGLSKPRIIIAQEAMDYGYTETNIKELVRHELVHAVDHAKGTFDFSRVDDVAYSEVRAANLSGDCCWMNRFRRQPLGMADYEQCVRTRAARATTIIPECPDLATAEAAVAKVYDKALADVSPFFRHPTK